APASVEAETAQPSWGASSRLATTIVDGRRGSTATDGELWALSPVRSLTNSLAAGRSDPGRRDSPNPTATTPRTASTAAAATSGLARPAPTADASGGFDGVARAQPAAGGRLDQRFADRFADRCA